MLHKEEIVLFNCELDVKHISHLLFKGLTNILELFIDLRHLRLKCGKMFVLIIL